MALLYIKQAFSFPKSHTFESNHVSDKHKTQSSDLSSDAPTSTLQTVLPQEGWSESTISDLEAGSPSQNKKRFWRLTVSARTISNATLGLSDGLTVPFALTAGLASLGNTRFVILGGLAELIAGAISMGLGGYVGAKSEEASYLQTLRETRSLVEDSPERTTTMIHTVFSRYNIPESALLSFIKQVQRNPEELVHFLMTFHHELTAPDSNRAFTSAFAIAVAYFIGGFIPIIPYLIVKKNEVLLALWWSIGVMVVTLFAFGYAKTCVVSGWTSREGVWAAVRGGVQMVVVGGVAAGAAAGLVRALSHAEDLGT